jgi:putative flippase GtrA
MPVPKIVRYIISGIAATFTNLCMLFALVHFLYVQYLVASIGAFIFGFCVSFILQKFWTFNNREWSRAHFQLTLYLMVALVGLLINTFLIYIFVSWLNLWYLLGQFIANAIVATMSYFAYKKLVFVVN